MWYTQTHESTHFCPRPFRRGTAVALRRAAFLGCLCAPSQPNSVGLCPWGNRPPHREGALLRRTNGSPCHPRVQPGGTFSSASRIKSSPPSSDRAASRRDRRYAQNGVASPASRFRLPDQPVDARASRQAVCASRVDGTPSQHRNHAPNAQPIGDQLEAGQALDYQSRSAVPGKKTARDRLLSWASQEKQAINWAIGFLDEVWWSRFALPKASAWQDQEEPVRFVEQRWQKADPDAKALACYGVLWQRGSADAPIRDQMSLRFVDGRPVSDITTQFLACCCTKLEAQGKRAWLLIWDNASWHCSKIVRTWIREHNQQVKASGKGVRILPLFLPTQSPWLNPIEPKWVHGKRAVVEPNGLLSAKQLIERICAYYHCSYEAHLSIQEKVS